MPPVAVTEFQDTLAELAAKSGEASDKLLRRISSLSPQEARAFITDAYPALLAPFLNASAELTTQWYAEQPTMERRPGSAVYTPEPAPIITNDQLAVSGRWALTQASPMMAMQGSSTRHVMNASRQTVVYNARRENVRWVRQAKLNACGFCKMLATRSVLRRDRFAGRDMTYTSQGVRRKRDSAGNLTKDYTLVVIGKRGNTRGTRSLGSEYHDHCRCTAVPLRDGSYDPPDYVQQWTEDYKKLFDKNGGNAAAISRGLDAGRARAVKATVASVAETAATTAAVVNTQAPSIASPAQVDRSTLDYAGTIEQAANYIRDKYGIEVERLINSPMANGIPVEESLARGVDAINAAMAAKPHFINVTTAKEVAQAVDDMLEKYPFVTLDEIKADFYPAGNPLSASAYATRKLEGGKTVGARNVSVTSFADAEGQEAGTAYRRYQKWLRSDAADERYKEEAVKRPVYAVIIHEMGHVLDFASGGLASTRVAEALRKYISNLPEAQKIKELPAVKRLTGDQFTYSTQYQDFEKQWLRENLCSAYSFKASDRASGVINMVEAMAEAFADVELRGDGAEIASKIIHRAMVDAAREYTGAK